MEQKPRRRGARLKNAFRKLDRLETRGARPRRITRLVAKIERLELDLRRRIATERKASP